MATAAKAKASSKAKAEAPERPSKPGSGLISVPEEIGSDLKVLPAGTVHTSVEKVMLGKSAAGHDKITIRHIITEEMDEMPEGETAIGEAILESMSLQPQAMWKLNSMYKEVTGDRLPQGDYSKEEFLQMMVEALVGSEWECAIEPQTPEGQSEERTVIVKKSLA